MAYVSIILLLLIAAPASADETYARKNVAAGKTMELDLGEVRPTQAAIGVKPSGYNEQVAPSVLRRQIQKRMPAYHPRVVLGPGCVPYLIDGHHRVRKMWDQKFRRVTVRVVENWCSVSPTEFWKRMEERKWVYLRDGFGQLIRPEALPDRIDKLGYDPFRKLAAMALSAGAYGRSSIPFHQFYWGEYFRAHIPLLASERADPDLEKLLPRAMELARSPQASGLQGYLPVPAIDTASCAMFYKDMAF